MLNVSSFFVVAGVVVLGAAPALARPAYVGTWAHTASACKLPPDTLDAPVVMKPRSYSQFETECTFGPVSRSGGAWHTRASCNVTGDLQKDTLTIWAGKSRMSLKWGGSPKRFNYVRCK